MKFLQVILTMSLLLVLPVVSSSLISTSFSNLPSSSISPTFNHTVCNKTRDSSISPVLNGTFFSNITNSSISTSLNISSPYWLSPSGNVAFGFYKLPCSRTSPYCADRYVVGIWFVKSPLKTLVWTTNGDVLRKPSSIHFTNDGDFLLREMPENKDKRLIPNLKEPVSFGVLQDDGNLLFYGPDSQIVWQSFDHPTDTVLGGQNLRSGVDLNSSGKRLHSLKGENKLSVQDSNGLGTISSPEVHTTLHFSMFEGQPTWKQSSLKYSLSPFHIIRYIKSEDILSVLDSSFGRWSEVVPINFTRTDEYRLADITIGFYYGDHGDGVTFSKNILAHAFAPPIGMLHFNGDIIWSTNFGLEKRQDAYDLESVATHEIGHLLGLGHSSIPDAVMFPSLASRTKKTELTSDDILGVQKLYGANATYSPHHHGASNKKSVSLLISFVSLLISFV